jgi:hypothetical protein
MNDLQKKRAAALFGVRRADLYHENNFVNQMSASASLMTWTVVTPKQDLYLAKLCWKYRQQLEAKGLLGLVPPLDPRTEATV